jgi:hypothetical protein
MGQPLESMNPGEVAAQIVAYSRALPVRNTAAVRTVRRQYSAMLKQAAPTFMLDLARDLIETYDQR